MNTFDLALDNPIWAALNTQQQYLAQGDVWAKRFPKAIGPLSGMVDQSAESYDALTKLAEPNEKLVLFLQEPPTLPPGWIEDFGGPLTQMVLEKPLASVETSDIVGLTDADVPDMLELTGLTEPGPFREKTHTLGYYVGIRQAGQLVAMAGERLHLDGLTEISAVCTHPHYQGKGYAKRLMTVVANQILARGETPFLHAWHHNHGAIRVYEKLGFVHRRMLHVAVIKPGK